MSESDKTGQWQENYHPFMKSSRDAAIPTMRLEYSGESLHDGYSRALKSILPISIGRSRQSQAVFYHYTTRSNFENILKSGQLWATEAKQLNDHTEVSHGKDLLIRRIQQYARKLPAAQLQEVRSELDHITSANSYIISLSLDGNSLSQWRAYGKQGGVAIGFPIELFEAARVNRLGMHIGVVLYAPDQQIRAIDPIAKFLADELSVNPATWRSKFIESGYGAQFSVLTRRLKNQGFVDEREVRLIFSSMCYPLHSRLLNGRPVPYIKFPFRRYFRLAKSIDFLIDTVYTAPGPEPLEDMRTIEKQLRKYAYRYGRILASDITLRWD